MPGPRPGAISLIDEDVGKMGGPRVMLPFTTLHRPPIFIFHFQMGQAGIIAASTARTLMVSNPLNDYSI